MLESYRKNKKGFTLIELLAVIVLLAILALITIPIVLRLVNDSRRKSAIRSAENYLDGVKKAVMNDNIDSEREIESCEIVSGGREVNCDDGSTSGVTLTVDVDGNKPSSGTIIFTDGSVTDVQDLKIGKFYISGTVEGDGLTATTKSAEEELADGTIPSGTKIKYKGEKYYVLFNSPKSQEYVTALKLNALSDDEVIAYGMDSNNVNHVNVYTMKTGENVEMDGDAAKIAWYSNQQCYRGYTCYDECGDRKDVSACVTSYDSSDIKVIVDNWANASLDSNDLVSIDGYKWRLLRDSDFLNNLKYTTTNTSGYGSGVYFASKKSPKWLQRIGRSWMMDIDGDAKNSVHYFNYGTVDTNKMYTSDWSSATVRPVINLKKSAIEE